MATTLAPPPTTPPSSSPVDGPGAPAAGHGRGRRALDLPARARLLSTDIAAVAAGVVLLVIGLWVRDGGVAALLRGGTPMWTSLAQITGLTASGAGLAGLYLVARPKALEQAYGIDRLFVWHRILGESMALLIAAHVATSLVSWQADLGWWSAFRELTGGASDTATAAVGALLIVIVTLSSLRSIRRRMAYETWYFLHLTAYAGFALSFFHQLSLGSDVGSGRTRTLWIALHIAVGAGLLVGRWGRLIAAARRPLRVLDVTPLNDDTVAVRIGGPNLAMVTADAGQFFVLRPLTPRLWWQAHPFSLSNAPAADGLRFTVKARGDASAAITRLRPGTKVVVEGPYGAHTPDGLAGTKTLLIAGGVGIAPIRSLLERLRADAEPIVLIRARHASELVHLEEIRALAARSNGRVHVLVGPTALLAGRDPFAAEELRRLAPDIHERHALLCGPERLLHAARAGVRAAGVPSDHIHYERPWW
jgi:predicted ferric reductase